ncbi:hypothetical protein PPTG_09854 [Phytophthora nicotianae INRA-310]|uniref:RxLR effector protein n=1 Tax=Phytophthora nicotianae (strain INRA-310) TaxID=761204 RepID=W2QC82_PHYN3|nr:hypothetical protein PPTG_09854 [Phytophthora nicotianae INRA-310]ETN10773.1 hypothetical protein PPTG_09854 [Phytophthora nicotianae INRA-310]
MNFGKLFPLVGMMTVVSSAVVFNAAPAYANLSIYYERPNSGGYPYPTPTPEAAKPCEYNTEAPTPQIHSGRPESRGYLCPTPAPRGPDDSDSSEYDTVNTTTANEPNYYGHPNDGGDPLLLKRSKHNQS